MAIAFLPEFDHSSDNSVMQQVSVMDWEDIVLGISAGPRHIIDRFYICIMLRIVCFPLASFQSIREHHLNVELPALLEDSFATVLTANNGNNYGSATLYLAAIHSIRSLSLDHFRVLLLRIEERIITLTKLAEKLCVMLNAWNSQYLNYFLAPNQNAYDDCIETKRKLLLYFLQRKLSGNYFYYVGIISEYVFVSFINETQINRF